MTADFTSESDRVLCSDESPHDSDECAFGRNCAWHWDNSPAGMAGLYSADTACSCGHVYEEHHPDVGHGYCLIAVPTDYTPHPEVFDLDGVWHRRCQCDAFNPANGQPSKPNTDTSWLYDHPPVAIEVVSEPPRTHRTRVAGTRPGFIAPTATAGGDAPPITHTKPPAGPGSIASTRTQVHQPPHSFTANNRTAVALVSAMVAFVLLLAVLALAVVLDASPFPAWAIALTAGGSVGLVALLTVPAALVVRKADGANRYGCDDDTVTLGDGFWSIDEDKTR